MTALTVLPVAARRRRWEHPAVTMQAACLAVLVDDGTLTTMDVAVRVRQRSRGLMAAESAAVCTALSRLRERGWVTSVRQSSPDGSSWMLWRHAPAGELAHERAQQLAVDLLRLE